MYYVNRESEKAGGEALYYQERRHNDQMVFALNTAFNHEVNKEQKYTLGASYNRTKGMHYKTMADLLGGSKFTDIDKFAASDYGPEASKRKTICATRTDKSASTINLVTTTTSLSTMHAFMATTN